MSDVQKEHLPPQVAAFMEEKKDELGLTSRWQKHAEWMVKE